MVLHADDLTRPFHGGIVPAHRIKGRICARRKFLFPNNILLAVRRVRNGLGNGRPSYGDGKSRNDAHIEYPIGLVADPSRDFKEASRRKNSLRPGQRRSPGSEHRPFDEGESLTGFTDVIIAGALSAPPLFVSSYSF